MRQTVFLIPLFLLMSGSAMGQSDSSFDVTYFYVATKLASTNKTKAILVADSLLKAAREEHQRVKALMLLASLEGSKGDAKTAIMNALKAEQLASKIKDKDWQIRSIGFLSTAFRGIGLYEREQEYIKKAEALNEQFQSPLFGLYIEQEKAFLAIENKNYKTALSLITATDSIAAKLLTQNASPVFVATSLYLQGDAFRGLGKPDSAKRYFRRALQLLNGQDSEIIGFVYQKLGQLALEADQLDSAHVYLEMGEALIQKNDNFLLKLALYQSLSKYYSKIGNFQTALKYKSAQSHLEEQQMLLLQTISDGLLKEFGEKQRTNHKRQYALYITIFFAMGMIVFLILFFNIRTKKKSKQFKEIIVRIRENHPLTAHISVSVPEAQKDEDNEIAGTSRPPSTNIPNAVIEKILSNLDKFEKSKLPLDPKISLPMAASKLGTNTKYLSYVIREYKKYNFNAYINELRIRYIISKLMDEDCYLNYKIAALAEECGFSSHSKFSMVFKEITQSSPSSFIKRIKNGELQSVG